jgi:hypothetical protein
MVLMINSDSPPPLPEAGAGLVRPVRFSFDRVNIDSSVPHSKSTRLVYRSAWVAQWEEPALDLSTCPRPKDPADAPPRGPVHRLLVVSDNGDAATVYQGATINCGQLRPPVAAQVSQTLSVPWHVSARAGSSSALTFIYPRCGTPAGGEGHNGRWYVLVAVPVGAACSGTVVGRQLFPGAVVPPPGRVGVVRETVSDPLAAPWAG